MNSSCGVFSNTFGVHSFQLTSQRPKSNVENMLPQLSEGNETILFVEDDPVLQQIVKTMLERSGYRILTAQNGEEGLILFLNTPDPIHLILTDVIMPKKTALK